MPSVLTVRTSPAEVESLRELVRLLGGRVSQREAIRQAVLHARATLEQGRRLEVDRRE